MLTTFFTVVLFSANWVAGDIYDNPFLQHAIEEQQQQQQGNTDRVSCEAGGSYNLPHKDFCDRFYTCQMGKIIRNECADGLGFIPYVGCKPLHVVDCGTRHKLQHPKGRGVCQRLYGIFDDPRGCGRYYRCVNGTATSGRCPNKYIFNDRTKQCRKPTKAEHSRCYPPNHHHHHHQHPSETPSLNDFLSGFECPEVGSDLLPFGQHSRHPYPGNCQLFIMCLKDGSVKIGGCEDGQAFSSVTGVCVAEEVVDRCRVKSF